MVLERNGGDDGTRTRDLCRDRVAWLGFTTTYKTAGTAKLRVSRTRHRTLWVRLWVGVLENAWQAEICGSDPGLAVPTSNDLLSGPRNEVLKHGRRRFTFPEAGLRDYFRIADHSGVCKRQHKALVGVVGLFPS